MENNKIDEAIMIPKELSDIADRLSIEENGCWLWTGATTKTGYGRIQIDSIIWRAHRYVAWKVMGLEPRSGQIIRHRCEEHRCCNPDHLLICDRDDTSYTLQRLQTKKRTKTKQSDKWLRAWIVNGQTYMGLRHTINMTGLSQHTLLKYTNKETRVFDVEAYRAGCRVARVLAKV